MDRGRMLTAAIAVLIFGGVLGLGAFMLRWQYRKAEQLVDEWARQHNYRILEREESTPSGDGPMNRYGKNKALVYSVKLTDTEGRTRRAKLTIGSPEVGVLSDQVSVEWEP